MKKTFILAIAGTLCIVGYFVWKKESPFGSLNPINSSQSTQSPDNSSRVTNPKYPVPSPAPSEKPVPKIEESDSNIQKETSEFFGNAKLEDVLIFQNFIRNFVVTIENATGKKIPVAKSPVKTAPGKFAVFKSGEDYVLSAKNFKRYRIYMELVQRANLKNIVAYYRRVYPLFQSAYQELGTQGYFNDKVIEVIDQILSVPDAKDPIHLKKVNLEYQFADQKLESLSAVQKILLRMGPKNADLLKAKFKELRQLLIEK